MDEFQKLFLLKILDGFFYKRRFFFDESVQGQMKLRRSTNQKRSIVLEVLAAFTVYLRIIDESQLCWKSRQKTVRYLDSYRLHDIEIFGDSFRVDFKGFAESLYLFAAVYQD